MTPVGRHHHQHHDAPERLVAEVRATCATRGLRLTETRERVLELIAVAGRPVKAYDLLESLKRERGAAAPPTVYRALDFLLEHGFIHRLESINAFVSCHHPSVRHTVPFLICDICESATEMCDSAVAAILDEDARRVGFLPGAQTLEVHGVCKRCREGGRRG
jgi:Fur family zinc uptake transcriptional regulator